MLKKYKQKVSRSLSKPYLLCWTYDLISPKSDQNDILYLVVVCFGHRSFHRKSEQKMVFSNSPICYAMLRLLTFTKVILRYKAFKIRVVQAYSNECKRSCLYFVTSHLNVVNFTAPYHQMLTSRFKSRGKEKVQSWVIFSF